MKRHPLEAKIIAQDLRRHGHTFTRIEIDLRFFGYVIAMRTIKYWCESVPDPQIAVRKRAVSLLKQGVRPNTVASIVGVYYSTIIEWRKKFLDAEPIANNHD